MKQKVAKSKRLTPQPATLRELYLKSGNLCAFPGCPIVMINNDGVVVGEICHIEAAEENGPRFNSSMSNEQRRHISNLMLMCGTHHTLVDKSTTKYPVSALKKMKQEHEARFSEVGDSLKRRFENQYKDVTADAAASTPTKIFDKLEKEHGVEIPQSEREYFLSFLDDFAKVPLKYRKFLLAVLKRAKKMDSFSGRTVSVHVDDLATALNVGQWTIRSHSEAFSRYRLGGVDPEDKEFSLTDPADFFGWLDLYEFAEEKGIAIEEFILDLRFGLLDR